MCFRGDRDPGNSRPVHRYAWGFLCLLLLSVMVALFSSCGHAQRLPGVAPVSAGPRQSVPPTDAELRAALEQALDDIKSGRRKQPAIAPNGDRTAVFDLALAPVDPDGAGPGLPIGLELSWTEQFPGDFDQNGEVNLADLSCVSRYWNRTVAYDPPNWHSGLEFYPSGDPEGDGALNWRLARVDGDGNGVINLADVTTIAQHWQETLSGYQVGSLYTSLGKVYFAAELDPADSGSFWVAEKAQAVSGEQQPVRYSCRFAARQWGTPDYLQVVGLDAGRHYHGSVSNATDFVIAAQQDPTAKITTDVKSGALPLTVRFDASGSSTPIGTLVKYEWDWEGDGTYDLVREDPGPVEHTYDAVHTYSPTLRVTDCYSRKAVGSCLVDAGSVPDGPAWHKRNLLQPYYHVYNCTMLSVGGRPGVFFRAMKLLNLQDLDGIWYTEATDELGTKWSDPVLVSASRFDDYHRGELVAAVIGGMPAVAFISEPETDLYAVNYSRALDPSGQRWNTMELKRDAYFFAVNGLGEVDACPLLVFTSNENYPSSRLNCLAATDQAGTAWVDTSLHASGGDWTSLTVLGGTKPVVLNGEGLGYGFAYNTVEDAVWVGQNSSDYWSDLHRMTLVENAGALLVALDTSPAGEVTPPGYWIVTIGRLHAELPPHVNQGYMLALPDEYEPVGFTLTAVSHVPMLYYFLRETNVVNVLVSMDLYGSSWYAPQTITPVLTVREAPTLVDVNGRPAMCFADNPLTYAVYY